VNTEDAKVGEYLRKFTFLSRAEIEALEAQHHANPGAREAHKALAREVTRTVHGQAGARSRTESQRHPLRRGDRRYLGANVQGRRR